MIAKVLGAALIASLVASGWLYVQGLQKDKVILSMESDITVLTAEKAAAEASVATLQETNALQAVQVAAFQAKVAEMDAERARNREDVEYVRNLFNGHDFRKLLAAKPGLIEKRMIDGSALVLKELEDVTAPD